MSPTQKELIKTSKFFSYVLRHKPEAINLYLDDHGWAYIDELIEKAKKSNGLPILDYSLVSTVVETSDKNRFSISEDGKRIRANQGHSIKADLQLTPQQALDVLYHGTALRFLESIKKEGLKPGQRQHVHLSADIETARQVGQRYGKPIVLTVNAKAMYQQGHNFFLSQNGVWLADIVLPGFIDEQL